MSQYDKDDVEAIGLVKFDFLGLATLTILEIAKDFIRERHPGQEDFAFENIPLDDPHTYRLFADGKTEAVFQFESRGMQGMLRDARPSRLEDLIALNALYRPGPMDLIPSFCARKNGREQVEYPHPLLEPMLSETYGIMVYQEQVMQTAQILGGYSLGGADLLRRAMGKKKAEEMAEHRQIFRAGAAKNNIGEEKADEIFDLMEKFAGYGFNKSHAAAYSLLAYHTAWLQGALHGRVLLRQHDRGNGRHRQAQGLVRGRPEEFRPDLRAARTSTAASTASSRSPTRRSATAWAPSRARASRRSRPSSRRAKRAAPSPACTTSVCGSTARASTSARWRR